MIGNRWINYSRSIYASDYNYWPPSLLHCICSLLVRAVPTWYSSHLLLLQKFLHHIWKKSLMYLTECIPSMTSVYRVYNGVLNLVYSMFLLWNITILLYAYNFVSTGYHVFYILGSLENVLAYWAIRRLVITRPLKTVNDVWQILQW